jgi:ubiquinol-cytochrome c reductase cytochrome b/c1 subunit
MSHGPREAFKNPIIEWIDSRLPLFTFMNKEYGTFPTPRNFNYLWNFGALSMVMLIVMIATGIFLAMNYTPSTDHAFASVEHIMRDVNGGWLLRYLHANGASMFFIVVYVHIFRGIFYGSYKAPRELLWIFGVVILLLMMATAFMGYVLPWGQMSFWGATVITSLFGAIPVVGKEVVTWLWGGFSVDNPTLNRFFALHYLLPFVLIGVVGLHVAALHVSGSNNPLGIEPKSDKDTVPFHPYYTVKDLFGLTLFLIFFSVIVFYDPNYLGHPDNYIPANPMSTPAHIVPEWYFLPFYAILRAIPSKLGGVLAMFGAIVMLVILPWLDRSPVRSALFRPWFRVFFWLFAADAVTLGFIGSKPVAEPFTTIGQVATFYYFFHFLVILPLLSKFEKTLPLPSSISESVLAKKTGVSSVVLSLALLVALSVTPAMAAENDYEPHAPSAGWPHEGAFGTYDRAALQRGYQVYKEVCSNCHSMKLLSYRNLADLGFSENEVKAIAAGYTVADGPNDAGEMFQRPARPSDFFVKPFPNDQAARAANNGALPPDLSLMIKARHGHEDYVYSLLTGFGLTPKGGEKVADGMYFNPYFPGHQIAMPPPLMAGSVTYADGTTASVEQEARDVVQFLTWAAEPKMEVRKQTGARVILFLVLLAGIMYLLKREIWKKLH